MRAQPTRILSAGAGIENNHRSLGTAEVTPDHSARLVRAERICCYIQDHYRHPLAMYDDRVARNICSLQFQGSEEVFGIACGPSQMCDMVT